MTLYGIDISKWQADSAVDLAEDFCIIKATEGVGYTDPTCEPKYQLAKKRGKLLGVYHFARPDGNTAIKEADYFIKETKGYHKEAILVLDWETGNTKDVKWAKAWLDRVYDKTGVKPLIYMNAATVNSTNWSSVSKDYGLWLAGYPNKYNVKNPPKPKEQPPYAIGSWKAVAIWQYTSSAGTLDRNIAYMDKTAWGLYAGKSAGYVAPKKKTNEQIAQEVVAGKWGNGVIRKSKLKLEGYNYDAIQKIVNRIMAERNKPKTVIHIVKAGENLSSIAAKYKTTWQNLKKLNNIKNANLIYPGQKIRIK